MTRTSHSRLVGAPLVVVQRLVRCLGYVLIPEWEIQRMEAEGAEYYPVAKRVGISERNAGYFNGLADYASKKGAELRQKYAPNEKLRHGGKGK